MHSEKCVFFSWLGFLNYPRDLSVVYYIIRVTRVNTSVCEYFYLLERKWFALIYSYNCVFTKALRRTDIMKVTYIRLKFVYYHV